MKKFLITSVLLGIYAASAPAVLASEEISVRKVSFGDLDLSSEAGQQTLHRRLSSAVSTVCGRPDMTDLVAMKATETCRKAAWASTRTQVALSVISAKRRLALATDLPVQSVRIETRR